MLEMNVVHHLDYLDMMRQIPDSTVSAVITDPPFGMRYKNKKWHHNNHKVLQNDEDEFSYESLAIESYRVLKDPGIIIACTNWRRYPDHFKQVESAGFKMKQPIICQKQVSIGGDLTSNLQSNSDWTVIGFKGSFNFKETQLIKNKGYGIPHASTIVEKTKEVDTLFGKQDKTERYALQVDCAKWKKRMPACWFGPEFPHSTEAGASKVRQEFNHPTMKSLTFMKWLIQLTTDEGDTIVEPFSGSATCPLACKQLNRNFFACDIEKKFVDMGNRRLRMNRY